MSTASSKGIIRRSSSGPITADQIRPGDPYELSNGHPILCAPQGGRGAKSNLGGGAVIFTDPAGRDAGVDVGYSPEPKALRAPDIAVGDIPDEPGWVRDVPLLAVEYADTGQDEGELREKISELLQRGTRYIWVVRLTGPRRVEVHERDRPVRLLHPGDELTAPGV